MTDLPSKIPFLRPAIGDRVTSTHKAIRASIDGAKTWKEIKAKELVDGIYVGYRYKSKGYIRYNEEYSEWIPEGTCAVALIIVKENQDPIPVPFDRMDLR